MNNFHQSICTVFKTTAKNKASHTSVYEQYSYTLHVKKKSPCKKKKFLLLGKRVAEVAVKSP